MPAGGVNGRRCVGEQVAGAELGQDPGEHLLEIAGAAGTSPGWRSFDEGVVCHVPDLGAERGFDSYPQQMLERTEKRLKEATRLKRRKVKGIAKRKLR